MSTSAFLEQLHKFKPAFRACCLRTRAGILRQIIADHEGDDLALHTILHTWWLWARDDQLIDIPTLTRQGKMVALAKCGRAWGKTRSGAEMVCSAAEDPDMRIALVGRTTGDVRTVMIEGESGILARSPIWNPANYIVSQRKVTWKSGAQATVYSADKPDQLRGPQHHLAWCDELCAWRFIEETWSNLIMGLRLGQHPFVFVTTTPRVQKLIKALMADPTCHVIEGSTYANKANLPEAFLAKLEAEYAGSRLGQQELEGLILDDMEGALWSYAMLEQIHVSVAPRMIRVVIGVDPAITHNRMSDATGIVAVGLGEDGKLYVLGDYSMVATPAQWGAEVLRAVDLHHADCITAETNRGGDMIEYVLKSLRKDLPALKTIYSSDGKTTRAEPISALYEQGHVRHVGHLVELEEEMATWQPLINRLSPNRVDALVFACTELKPNLREYQPDQHAIVPPKKPEIALSRKMVENVPTTGAGPSSKNWRSRWR